jgi:uncharacterized protein
MSRTEAIMNPFQFGRPVTGELFCNRRKELAHLQDLFRSRNSGWLYSPRRYGKTSLIKEAFALVEEQGLYTAYVDFMAISSGVPVAELYLRGIGPLVPQMTGGMERALTVVSGLLKSFVPAVSINDSGSPVLSVAPIARDSGAEPALEELLDLPEKLAQRTGSRVVVAIDEFQEVSHIKGLEERLRSAMQHHERVTYLMAGSRAGLLRDLFTSPERPFFQFGEHIQIERIARVELIRYVSGRFATTGVRIADSMIEKLVDLAAFHPHFVQYFASVAWNLCRETGCAEEELEEKVVERIVSALDPGFRMFFDSLAPSQKRLIVYIACNDGRLLTADHVRKKGRLGSASTVSSAVSVLAEKEVLVREKNEWFFVNPGFRLWVLARAVGDGHHYGW